MVVEKRGDVFAELHAGRMLLHQVNCVGVMGAGIAAQVRKRFPDCYDAYKRICSKDCLGKIYVHDCGAIKICNAFGQQGISRTTRMTDYIAWQSILQALIAELDRLQQLGQIWTVVAPYGIGCGLGGGSWPTMFDMLKGAFTKHELIICRFG